MRLIIQLLPLALLFIACPNKEDTCAPLGDTFIDVRQSDGPGGTLSLDLTTLDTLPATYFSQATLVRLATDQNGAPFNNLAENSSILQASPDSLRISLPVPQNSTAIAAGLANR